MIDSTVDPDGQPNSARIKLSDQQLLLAMVSRLDVGAPAPLTADVVYAAFLEAKKASDDWIKYYMIGMVLLIVAATHATLELDLFGTKLKGPFICPAALAYFSVCVLAYTNHELKMRLFKTFFNSQIGERSVSDRGEMLMRYPLAFIGSEYLPVHARPAGFMIGWREVLSSLPLLGVAGAAWFLSVYGLLAVVCLAIWDMLVEPTLSIVVKMSVLAFFLASAAVSGSLLRNPKAVRKYTSYSSQN